MFGNNVYLCTKIGAMPTNKNALIRYKHLDMLLSDRHHYYDIGDLVERVNRMLYDDGFPEVTRRCIEKDIICLQEAPFRASIKHFKWNGNNKISVGTIIAIIISSNTWISMVLK